MRYFGKNNLIENILNEKYPTVNFGKKSNKSKIIAQIKKIDKFNPNYQVDEYDPFYEKELLSPTVSLSEKAFLTMKMNTTNGEIKTKVINNSILI